MDNTTLQGHITVIGQRGRLILPAALQQATGIEEGTRVVLRSSESGVVTVEPLSAVPDRLRRTVGPMLPLGGTVSTRWGGRPGLPAGVLPTDVLPRRNAPKWSNAIGYAETSGTDLLAVLTAGAVLAWLAGPADPANPADPAAPMPAVLPYAVLPEQAVTQFVTALARAGCTRDQVATVLADLQLLGLRLAAPGIGHTDLAEDTVTALELATAARDRDGAELDATDALCAAVALRLGVLLLATS
ncbi:AbrB/MazE/SpoVT family DNA-binding domain-containing protein [Kitasatospora sp. NPDC004272]